MDMSNYVGQKIHNVADPSRYGLVPVGIDPKLYLVLVPAGGGGGTRRGLAKWDSQIWIRCRVSRY